MTVRRSDFAGSWYPDNESDCRQLIEEFLEADIAFPSTGKKTVGGIVPHAGWFFSGKIACHVIKCLKKDNDPDTVVIFGRHLHTRSNNYIMKEGKWATPLGDLDIDQESAERLISEFHFTVETASRYEQDNTIELQLPFIKYFFPDAQILPIGVAPRVASLDIGERLAEISGMMNRKMIFIGSTDLTHYGRNYAFTPKGEGKEAVEWVKNENDTRVIDLMLKMDAEGVIHESLENSNACCAGAAGTAIAGAKILGAEKGEKLIYSTSYEIRPDTSFVGYVGVVFQ